MSTNTLATCLIWLAAVFVTAVFICVLADIISQGLTGLSWAYLIEPPQDAGRAGGIGSVIVSTGLILLVAIATSAPLGLATALLLTEFSTQKSRFAQFVERSLDVLSGIPSIVFGLFGNAFFCIYLGLGFSILSGP